VEQARPNVPTKASDVHQGLSLALRILNVGPLLILILLVISVSAVTPSFYSPINLGNILAQVAVIATVAVGQHVVILTRGIDLSVGANLALATVMGGLTYRVADSALAVALAIVGAATLVGLANGLAYVYGRLPHPFIITLATLSICRGLALQLSVGHTTMRGMPDGINLLGDSSFWVIPNSFYVVAATVALVAVLAKKIVWGRWIYAVGGSPNAAVGMGIPIRGVLVSVYALSGFCTGVGALLLAGRTGASSPLYGDLLELDTIAAVIIGFSRWQGPHWPCACGGLHDRRHTQRAKSQ
jgi:ribose transport system permease protein